VSKLIPLTNIYYR